MTIIKHLDGIFVHVQKDYMMIMLLRMILRRKTYFFRKSVQDFDPVVHAKPMKTQSSNANVTVKFSPSWSQ